MKGTERRDQILRYIQHAAEPVSGTQLAEHFEVSRQVIVQDIALLRAANYDIISTTRGYLLHSPMRTTNVFKVHHSQDNLADELTTIVDLGGTILDVFVRHKVYGELRADLKISSRLDIQKFMENIASGKSAPLMDVTSGYHYHTVSAASEQTLTLITEALQTKGYLVPPENMS